MYKCIDCQAEFEEPDMERECMGEYHGQPDMERECMGEYHGQPAYEYRAICPLCGSYDFEEVTDGD